MPVVEFVHADNFYPYSTLFIEILYIKTCSMKTNSTAVDVCANINYKRPTKWAFAREDKESVSV